MEVKEVKRTMVFGWESERMNVEVEVKVAKIVCTKGHKVIKKRSLNDCQDSLYV